MPRRLVDGERERERKKKKKERERERKRKNVCVCEREREKMKETISGELHLVAGIRDHLSRTTSITGRCAKINDGVINNIAVLLLILQAKRGHAHSTRDASAR